MNADYRAFVFVRRGRHNMGAALALWALNPVLYALVVAGSFAFYWN